MSSSNPFHPPLTGRDAVQAQLSESADSGAPLTPELRAQVEADPACAEFAGTWLQGPPAALLAGPASGASDAALRERILDAAALPSNVVGFSPPPLPLPAGHPPRTVWLARIAAALVVSALAYWLLDPVRSTGVRRPAVAGREPTLSQSFLQTENRSKREQQTIRTALVDGGREVNGNVAWAVSALDL